MKTIKVLQILSLLIILVVAVSCRSGRSSTGRQYPRTVPAETPTKTETVVVYSDGGNLPPGQAKKVYGSKSAKAYAPGQRKKYPLVIVYTTGIVIKRHTDGRYYYTSSAGHTYWKGNDGRYYIDEKHLKSMEYEASDYDDWKMKGQKNNKADEAKEKKEEGKKVKEDQVTKEAEKTDKKDQKEKGQDKNAKGNDQKEKDQAASNAKDEKPQKGNGKAKGKG